MPRAPSNRLMVAGRCDCDRPGHAPRLVVVTGGPGAGKTALLEVVRRHFCKHVEVLPEAASIVFGGGFPRRSTDAARRAAQRAIYHVQCELERCAVEEARAAVALCDRGTIDGVAYWPDPKETLFSDLGTTRMRELERYTAVIHLRTPGHEQGYDHANPLRIETPDEARAIDARIAEAWSGHPRLITIESTDDFIEKIRRAVAAIYVELPECCRAHRIDADPLATAIECHEPSNHCS